MGEEMKDSVVLMGCKHCGKTTQGRLLAQKLGVDFFDTDDEIARIRGMDPRVLYKTKGVTEFTLAEEEACKSIIQKNGNRKIVISTGGGICDNPPALQQLRDAGIFVFLRLDIKLSIERIMAKIQEVSPGVFAGAPAYVLNENPATLDDIRAILLEKYKERFKQYESLADIVVDIKNAPIEENFKTLLGALNCN